MPLCCEKASLLTWRLEKPRSNALQRVFSLVFDPNDAGEVPNVVVEVVAVDVVNIPPIRDRAINRLPNGTM
jgi:hypothetical protein